MGGGGGGGSGPKIASGIDEEPTTQTNRTDLTIDNNNKKNRNGKKVSADPGPLLPHVGEGIRQSNRYG
tara:strand:- start:809 stop:1012 length:204 start_codon:yes stop_codon:yes gene_type:complete